MPDDEIEETPVAPATIDRSPSSTGVVDGDGSEPTEAPAVEGME